MKLATHHPVKGVVSYLPTPLKERYLSHEEIQRLLSACPSDLRDMVVLALGTGMRASEVLGLDRDSLDLKHAVVKLADTKNGDRRVLPLPPQVVTALSSRPPPLRELFPGWTLKKLMQQFHRVTLHAGLHGVSFHTLRHTFASYAVMSGIDLLTVSKLLGHRSIKMVQRYAHLAPPTCTLPRAKPQPPFLQEMCHTRCHTTA